MQNHRCSTGGLRQESDQLGFSCGHHQALFEVMLGVPGRETVLLTMLMMNGLCSGFQKDSGE